MERHLWDRHFLFLPEWSYAALVAAVEEVLTQAVAPEWEAVATRIGRYMQWEFEDYDDSLDDRVW